MEIPKLMIIPMIHRGPGAQPAGVAEIVSSYGSQHGEQLLQRLPRKLKPPILERCEGEIYLGVLNAPLNW